MIKDKERPFLLIISFADIIPRRNVSIKISLFHYLIIYVQYVQEILHFQ